MNTLDPFQQVGGFAGGSAKINLKLCGEKLSSDNSSAELFVNELSGIIKGYSEHQIFYCDETGLYFKMLPEHTLASVHNWSDGMKKTG